MNAPLSDREKALMGMGEPRLRKEDARFIQGKGNYVDDIKLPGMVHMDIVRSPLAHARIKRINKEAALQVPGVLAVLTAEDLKPLKLHWMPTLAGDVAAVLADGKVHFQMQEVAVVIAEDPYAAADGVEAVEVEYEELPAVVDPFEALKPDAPVVREDLAGKTEGAHGKRYHHNHIFTWEAGDKAATDAVFAQAPVTVKQEMHYPRVHPCPLETCGSVASFDSVRGELTVWITHQAPHVVRTVVSMLSGLPESKVRIICPDIGGGFGNKVGIYPGYVCSIVASIVLGRPVKWVEDRIEHLSSTAFARHYHMTGELAATADGKILALRANVVADHGAFDACADPSKFPAGLFHICTGSYDIPTAYCRVDGVYTNKAPGGVAYRCSFRVTEAVYLIERMVDVLAQKLNIDKAEIRAKNFIRKEQFPYPQAFGFEYDSGDYHTALQKVLEAVDYKGLREEQARKRADPNCPTLMGIGLVTFTEVVGAGPTKVCDILGVGMFDSCEIRVHPTGSAIARMGTITQGQGHQTTYAQIIATELGIPSDLIQVEEGDTATAPYGLGTYGSRSTPVAGAAIAMAARKIHAKARKIAAHLLEVSEADLEWEIDRFKVKGRDDKFKTMKDIAWAAYHQPPAGLEPGLEAVHYYDPPNFTYPFGVYLCVVDIDKGTGETKIRRFYALDDCGTRINPMIIEGQIHGGLTEGFAVAMGQLLSFDKQGNIQGNSFMDYFIPTAVETPKWETDYTVTPSPHHPIGAKGVAESPPRGQHPNLHQRHPSMPLPSRRNAHQHAPYGLAGVARAQKERGSHQLTPTGAQASRACATSTSTSYNIRVHIHGSRHRQAISRGRRP
uniref:Carbon monoxide dehydrogenase large chain n=1 Tax=Pseudomonas thermocarboxydovorans TaxID=34066 RepID=Q52590_9PSED|nr:cut A [Pseudomonas thermocarboxydovorans]prf//2107180C Mo-containing hydroxylase CO dehydrogenase [Pseudomonas thermocarboxydovorans]